VFFHAFYISILSFCITVMTAFLLVNLGSPDSPAVQDVRRYLGEFLMDGNVIDVPTPLRALIVKGFILPFRPKRSAKAYSAVWWEEGSPLTVLSRRLTAHIAEATGIPTALGMRYGNPSIEAGLEELCRENPAITEVVVVPLYPQYAMATTKTVIEKTLEALPRVENQLQRRLSVRFLPPFYHNPLYISALAASVQDAAPMQSLGAFDHVLFSYHGIPERHIRKTDPNNPKARKGYGYCLAGDSTSNKTVCCDLACAPSDRSAMSASAHEVCYRHHAAETSRLLALELGLQADKWSMSFQSRLGADAWLQPYTVKELERLAKQGVKRLAVACPAFVSDCLETLEEIGVEGREIFLHNGGEEFTLIPCLNTHKAWIDALSTIIGTFASSTHPIPSELV
jgi:ferrochelatase